jgi:hypothetical protein
MLRPPQSKGLPPGRFDAVRRSSTLCVGRRKRFGHRSAMPSQNRPIRCGMRSAGPTERVAMRYWFRIACVWAVASALGCSDQSPCDGVDCGDDDACTADVCDPATGECSNILVIECDDDNVCTENLCNPANQMCEYPPVPSRPRVSCDFDGSAGLCVDGECQAACEVHDPCVERDCYVGACSPEDGECEYTLVEVGTPCGSGGHCCPDGRCFAPGLICRDTS